MKKILFFVNFSKNNIVVPQNATNATKATLEISRDWIGRISAKSRLRIRLQSSFRSTSSIIYTLKIGKLSQYLNFVETRFSIKCLKKIFFIHDFWWILGFQRLVLGPKIPFFAWKCFLSMFSCGDFFVRKLCKMMCFFEKMTMWYPRNDTYPEFGPQRTIRKGPFLASLNE